MPIQQLPPEVIAQIAAGEVVTRPGDAVKELVENAIDAILTRASGPGAGTIAVEIQDGGYTRIQVADDGCGIPAEELPLAVSRHATSKIAATEDLDRLVSLGFRGEALAAIAAVADLEILSALAGAPIGGAIAFLSGEVSPVRAGSRRAGTTVTIERIFERLPARRKFQRAPSSETAHIAHILQAFALAYPEIAFSLASDGRQLLRSGGTGDVRETVGAIFGPEVGRQMLVLQDDREAEDGSAGLAGIAGLIGGPDIHRATRTAIFLTVNRRPVDSRALTYAVEDAYTTQIPTGRHPVVLIDITVPPDEIDANVHPTKREVHLQRERLVFGVVQQSVRATLARAIGIPLLGERPWMQPQPVPSDGLEGGAAPLFPEPTGGQGRLEPERPRLGGLRILGQIGLTYIICEGTAGLYLVDQHAAHERVLLERLETALGHEQRMQLLLEPAALALPPALRGSLTQYVEALVALGFDAEPFGDADLVLRAVPTSLPIKGIERALQETLETLDAEGAGPDWRERLAVLLSCKTAIKAGHHLEIAEMQALLQQLDEANLCATCSHGRPTAILLSHAMLEREFGRS